MNTVCTQWAKTYLDRLNNYCAFFKHDVELTIKTLGSVYYCRYCLDGNICECKKRLFFLEQYNETILTFYLGYMYDQFKIENERFRIQSSVQATCLEEHTLEYDNSLPFNESFMSYMLGLCLKHTEQTMHKFTVLWLSDSIHTYH